MPVTVNGGSLEFEAMIHTRQFQAQLNSIEQGLHGLTNTAQKEANAIQDVVKQASAAMAAYASFSAASSFVADVVRVRGEFQALNAAFEVMLGSKAAADALLKDVATFASTTPFEFGDISAATRSLLAFGVSANDIKSTLKSLGDVSAGVGAPIKEIAEIYGKAKVQGRLFAEDINQLTGRGIPVIQELAKQFGVTDDKVKGLVESGKVGFPEIERAFQSLTAEGSKFGGMMQKMSGTISGQLSNLKDAWNLMLNDIGKSNEGAISGSINLLGTLVRNYQTVLDILKVLVITYGTYRAALLAHTTAMIIANDVQMGLTITQSLYNRAVILGQTAMALLNRTMLANPAVLITAGVVGLIAALVIFRKEADNSVKVQERLNDVRVKAQDAIIGEKSKLELLLAVAKDETKSKDERVGAIQKINAISPEYLGNLTLENLKTQEGVNLINAYVTALEKKANAQAAESSLVDINKEIIAENKEFKKQLERFTSGIPKEIVDNMIKNGGNVVSSLVKEHDKKIKDLRTQGEEIKKFYADTIAAGAKAADATPKRRTLEIIDAEIKAQKDLQAQQSATSKEYQEFQKKINALEAERRAIAGASKSEAKAAQSEENKINQLLEQRKSILDSIEGLRRDSIQSGMAKELSAVDRINEKYDLTLKKVQEYNDRVSKFNSAHKGSNVQGIGSTELDALKAARNAEISNTMARADAERFIKDLDAKKKAYEQYAESVKIIGETKSREMYASQTEGFTDYLTFLQKQADDIQPRVTLGIGNIGDQLKLDELNKQISAERMRMAEEEFKQRVEDFKRLFVETASYNQKRATLEEQFQKEAAVIRREWSGTELVDRMKALRAKYDLEERELKASLVRQSEAFKALGADLFLLNEKDLKDNLEKINKAIKDGFVTTDKGNGITEQVQLTPEMLASLQSGADKLKALNKEIEKTKILKDVFGTSASKLTEMAATAQDAAAIFSTLSDALAPVSPQLSDMAAQLSDIANLMGNVFSSLAKGDWVGAIVAVVGSVVKSLVDAGKSAREARKSVQEFYQAIAFGEIASAQATRERLLLEAQATKLTYDRLNAQKKALTENKKAQADQSAALLKQLQQEEYIASEKTKKGRGSLLFGAVGFFTGLGGKTKVEQEMRSLQGMTFEAMEKLFNSGQLSEKAKELFTQLQKLKAEGVDIEKQLLELAEQSKQIFTGTTANALLDSIVEGFKSGKRSAADFANDFQGFMQQAMLNSFKFQALEGPIQEFYDQFAAAAESGGALSKGEIEALQNMYNGIIGNATKQFEQLQQVAGINFNAGAAGSSANSLQGAIKGMSQQTAELIAGQMGGQRVAMLEAVAVARQNLNYAIRTESNTAQTVIELKTIVAKLTSYETGSAKLSIK